METFLDILLDPDSNKVLLPLVATRVKIVTSSWSQKLGTLTGGCGKEHLPRVFFKNFSQVGFNYVFSFTFWSVLCRCNCSLLRAALVLTKVHTEILTQEYDKHFAWGCGKKHLPRFFFKL